MRWAISGLLILSLLGFVSAAKSEPYSRMVNRVQSSVVRITGRMDVPFEGPLSYVCTGEVFAPNRVLTAAHCVGILMQVDGQAVDVRHRLDGPRRGPAKQVVQTRAASRALPWHRG